MFHGYKWLLGLVLVVLAAGLLLFFRFNRHDIKSLEGFLASYDRYDKALLALAVSQTEDGEGQAAAALDELKAKAAFRLSSLIKNDAGLMSQAREVAELAGQELESLKAYRRAVRSKNVGADELAIGHGVVREKRKAAYACFRELAGKGMGR